MTDAAVVRYACPCGHLAPIGSLFYSEFCQKLVCRQPSCSVEEFESYYCGNLLVNLPSKEANMYQNRSSRCFACVTCDNVLSTVFHDGMQKYFFSCSHCHWDSLEIGLVEDDPDMLLMTAVARERETEHEDVYHTLLSHHSSVLTSGFNARGRRASSISGFGNAGRTTSLQMLADSMKELQREQQMKKFRLQRMAEMGTWKYEHAVARLEERAQWFENQRNEHQKPELRKQLERFQGSARDDVDLGSFALQSDMGRVASLEQRLHMPLDQPRSAERLFPHRPLLRVKRTWRCVESIQRGSAGILVKPQISPMSGDSSLPIPASWFKKANLGVHFVPIITFQKLPHPTSESSEHLECVLLVENPLDDPVQIICRAAEDSTNEAQSQALLEDQTPILLGAYEDPSIADAFAGDARTTPMATAAPNRHVVASIRNLSKIHVPIRCDSTAGYVRFRLEIDMVKYDDALEEAIAESNFRFVVEFAAPVAYT
ncbi:hypothetical protein Poli38472_008957 [Pythium oligandrum]|uniref:Dynactin subunit 4 n=1 Tax=Pythium oligandrum TaxID=41045 RepID=A0A8K1FCY0_PYTOL|nr:hypothetical protein Poli38472_008957 [Pythium oligandrum]|eukprot:TMW56309.1 hypothetical protein Poli38472_008957 [Pythium oligandrum]